MLRKIMKKSLAVGVSFCLAATVIGTSAVGAANGVTGSTVYDEGTYGAYAQKYSDVSDATVLITVDAAAYLSQDGANATVTSYCDRDNVLLWDEMEGSVTYNVNVPETALYTVAIDYCPATGKGSAIDLGLMIDGEYPFEEVSSCTFSRIWKDDSGMLTDEHGDEYTPGVTEHPRWNTEYFRDINGYYGNEHYRFYLETGTHTLTLVCNNEALALSSIILSRVDGVATYAEVLKEYEKNGYKSGKTETEFIQAETPTEKSDQTLRAQYDRNSPLTQPFDASHIRYNCIGGNSWKYQSQWISWEIEVPEDGLYKLGARYRQETIKGFASSRKLTIDGALPFAEARCVNFAYTEDWDMLVFGKGDEPYLFYLTEGKHTLTLEVVMGDVSSSVEELQSVAENLMELYRRIVMITGTSPDPYRDYSIDESIPEMLSTLQQARRVLKAEKSNLVEITGNKAINTTTIQTLLSQIETVIKKPDSLVESSRLSSFSSNISSLSSWLLDLKYQPLTIDYFVLMSPESALPRVKANFFENFISGFKNFISSFIQDYGSVAEDEEGQTITIWLSVGRDQMQILKNMVSDMFTPKTGINVEIRLVSASLIQAILANDGPDVSVMTGRGDPVNLAIRNSLVDLSQLDGFDEVKSRFVDTATVPYTYNGGCYGIPDSLVYHMMFYRTDIFEQMGLTCPETWDDLLKIAPILQRNNMRIGLPFPATDASGATAGLGTRSIFPALLMQRGESFYNDKLTDTKLSGTAAYDAFRQWTEYYTLHGFALEYNFYSLFRTGEMPLGIAAYNMFNTLKVAAPEIDGLWKMVQIPGTVNEDGTINRTEGATGTAAIIFKQTDNLDASWEFIKWWTSDEAQTRYALDMESVMGISARQTPANIATLQSLAWTKQQVSVLTAQMNAITEIPEVPGGYYAIRNLENAYNATVVSGENARESLEKWTRETTVELERKREEFGIEG